MGSLVEARATQKTLREAKKRFFLNFCSRGAEFQEMGEYAQKFGVAAMGAPVKKEFADDQEYSGTTTKFVEATTKILSCTT